MTQEQIIAQSQVTNLNAQLAALIGASVEDFVNNGYASDTDFAAAQSAFAELTYVLHNNPDYPVGAVDIENYPPEYAPLLLPLDRVTKYNSGTIAQKNDIYLTCRQACRAAIAAGTNALTAMRNSIDSIIP